MFIYNDSDSDFENKSESAVCSYPYLSQGDTNKASLHVDIITTKSGFDQLEPCWNHLWEQTDCFIFQTFDWNRTWWDHFGEFGQLQIFALYDAEKLVGIAPLFYDSYSVLGWKTHLSLRLIGSRVYKTDEGPLLGDKAYSDYLQFIIHEEYTQTFLNYFVEYLKASQFDDLILEEVPERSSTLDIQNQNLAAHGFITRVSSASSTPYINPAENWEAYLETLDVKQRYNVRRSLKNIVDNKYRLFYLETLGCDENIEPRRNRFIRMHQQQWNNLGLPGTFAEKCMIGFFKDITDKVHKKGMLRIYTLYHKNDVNLEQCLGIDVMIACRSRMYGLHRAVDSGSPYYKKGPGKSLLVATIQEAIQTSCTFDFLRGVESYKLRLTSGVNENKTIVISCARRNKNPLTDIISFVRRIERLLIIERRKKRIIARQNTYYSTSTGYLKILFNRIKNRIDKKR